MTLKQMLQHPRVSGVVQAFALMCCLLGARPLAAQTFYVCSGNNTTTTSQLDFTDGSLQTSAIDSITIDVPAGQRFVGGDISLLPTYEEHGAKYFDQQGQALDNVLAFVKEQGWNAARVRLFVDPSKASATDRGQGVRQDLDYVAALGRRIKEAGMLFMLDFHYSDSWADPAKQWTPAAWLALTDEQLATQLYNYTRECLQRMNAEGASPDFIQTGNEISYGMLWGKQGTTANRCYMGSDDGWPRFGRLLKQACRACREVCPRAKIVIHTERAGQASVLKNFYQQMQRQGVDYDIIGLSYYPYYHGSLSTLSASLSMLERDFAGQQVMIVETGCAYHYQVGDDDTGYPLTYEGQRSFTADLIATLRQHGAVSGLFWWFPEANEYGLNWNTQRVTDKWYNAGLFDNETGRALPALYELTHFK